MSTQAQSEATADTEPVAGADLTLTEMLRIMDVATTLRKEQSIAQQQFEVETTRKLLREKLLQTAEVTGESLTTGQIDAAVRWYFEHLHEYRPPRGGLQLSLAHLYIRRGLITAWLGGAVAVVVLIWSLFFASFAPFSPSGRAQRQLDAAATAAQRSTRLLHSAALPETSLDEADRLARQAESQRENEDLDGLRATARQLDEMADQIQQAYVVAIVSGEGRSAVQRLFEDESGQRVSGYYVIVEARTADGKTLPQQIRNAETDRVERVRRWGERVPEPVYERLKADKLKDGVLDESLFARKRRGVMDWDMVLPGTDGKPLERQSQITRWD